MSYRVQPHEKAIAPVAGGVRVNLEGTPGPAIDVVITREQLQAMLEVAR